MKIKACLVTLALAISASLSAGAQSITYENGEGEKMARLQKIDTLDHSIMECVYEHTIFDPNYSTKNKYIKNPQAHTQILSIGRNTSLYRAYQSYVTDSIIKADYPTGITNNEYWKLSFAIGRTYGGKAATYILKNLGSGKLTYRGMIFMDSYIYEEDIPEIDWIPVEEETDICGYRCKTATASFRGREWTAWYTEDIPISNGPEMFGNLPGLILKIEDEKKEHVIQAIQIRKSNESFGVNKNNSAFKTDRKTFNKMQADFYNDPGIFTEGNPLAPTTLDGKPIMKKSRRMFFNPIEKE